VQLAIAADRFALDDPDELDGEEPNEDADHDNDLENPEKVETGG
jgi:hypothetical protein